MWGTGLFPSLCALLFDYFLFPGPHCLLPGTSAEYICYCGLQGSLSAPSSPDQVFHLPLFVAFPVSVRGEVVSRTLCVILVHFSSSPLDPLCPSSKQNLIFRCFHLFSSLLPHLPALLSTYFSSYSYRFFNLISMPLPSKWLTLAICPLCSSYYCLLALLSSSDCAMLCGRWVKGRPLLLLSWKIWALNRFLEDYIWQLFLISLSLSLGWWSAFACSRN